VFLETEVIDRGQTVAVMLYRPSCHNFGLIRVYGINETPLSIACNGLLAFPPDEMIRYKCFVKYYPPV